MLICNLSQKLFSSGLRLEISETMHPRAQVSEGASCTWSTTDSGAIYKANLTRQGTCFLLLFFSAFLAKPKSPIFVTESVMPVPAPSVNNLSYSSNYELRWLRDHEVFHKCLTQWERERNSFTGLRIISVHVSQGGNPWSKIPCLRFEDKLQEIGNVQGTWNESTCMCHYLKIFRHPGQLFALKTDKGGLLASITLSLIRPKMLNKTRTKELWSSPVFCIFTNFLL